MDQPADSDQVAAAIRELDNVREEWLTRAGVAGLDVGFRYESGRRTDEIVIRIHVIPGSAAAAADIFPARVGAIPVTVIEADYGFADEAGPETV